MIRFEDAEVRTPDGNTVIVHPLTLELRERRIALIGHNGSGKSTIARLINGLITPNSGRVTIETGGEALDTETDGRRVRQHVGFMFTDPRAQLVMPTAGEDVALSLRRIHKNKQERLTAAGAVLDAYGLGGRAEQSVHTLSGGQQQLLALATVLSTEPGILVADEPTTLLDLKNSRIIGDLLMNLEQQVIILTHDLDLAARCDRVLVIAEGTVSFDGTPADAISFYRDSVA